ncbi:MAG TPA: sugar phosphate isomerase/epimerase [Gemmataceae bacterium]|nr:sugar phosphate isomerase/epimerase [Gemmataceae bacterium]
MFRELGNRRVRRGAMGVVVAALLLGAMLCSALAAGPEGSRHPRINVGLQLYSLRAQLAKDVPGTLALVPRWRISDVEAAGFYNLSAKEFRKELDTCHLHASGAHFPWERFSKDIDGVIRDAKVLGCEYVTLAWIPHDGDFTAKDARAAAEKFNEWGRKCADAGLKFTYHAHGYEFRPSKDGTPFDLIARDTRPKFVNFELDIFWAYDGGADPVQLMRKYPSRFPQVHLKDMRKGVKTPNYTGHEDVKNDVALGTGQIPLPAILKEAVKIGVKHYYIEDESKDSEQQIPQSIRYVRSIGF